MRDPEERTPGLGLAYACDLDGVVGRRRAEPLPPCWFAVIAVRPGVGEDIDPVVPYLHGQRIRVSVCRYRQEPVGPAVAATPDLGAILSARAQEDLPSVGEPVWPARRSRQLTGAAERTDHAGLNAAVEGRPPGRGAQQGRAARQGDGPCVVIGIVDDECTSLIAVSLPRSPARGVQNGSTGIQHPRQALPRRIGEL